MALRLYTDHPKTLLHQILKLIDDGQIRTWSYDSDGDFTHTAAQYEKKAWLHPEIKADSLRLRIIAPEREELTRAVYAIYHGRFIEMAITHVPAHFTRAVAWPKPSNDEPELVE